MALNIGISLWVTILIEIQLKSGTFVSRNGFIKQGVGTRKLDNASVSLDYTLTHTLNFTGASIITVVYLPLK